MSLTRYQLLTGIGGLTFAPMLWLYQFFIDVRMSEHFGLVVVAVLWWLLGMFFYGTAILFSNTEDRETRPLQTLFGYLGIANGLVILAVVGVKILVAIFSL